MTDPTPPSSEAVCRFVIVSEALVSIAGHQQRVDPVRAAASRVQTCFEDSSGEISERRLQRWLAAHAERTADPQAGPARSLRPSQGP
ncbi:MAG: hypothetical protein IPM29_32305 [Planctomycetes bacterium]|nr:hypothetical protein [Planctomycetota bacterium]